MSRAPRSPRRQAAQSGMTLVEIMIAIAVLVVMMGMGWSTISKVSEVRQTFEGYEVRNHEIRVGLARVVADLEHAYLSKNEDDNATHRRTLFLGKSGGQVGDLRFSSLSHRILWSDAAESEQTQITYLAGPDRADGRKTSWLRRESRRLSNEAPDDEAAELDVVIADIEKVEFEFWDWRGEKWLDRWDTTSSDNQRGRLPLRVRIKLTIKEDGEDRTYTAVARLPMQEPLNFF